MYGPHEPSTVRESLSINDQIYSADVMQWFDSSWFKDILSIVPFANYKQIYYGSWSHQIPPYIEPPKHSLLQLYFRPPPPICKRSNVNKSVHVIV